MIPFKYALNTLIVAFALVSPFAAFAGGGYHFRLNSTELIAKDKSGKPVRDLHFTIRVGAEYWAGNFFGRDSWKPRSLDWLRSMSRVDGIAAVPEKNYVYGHFFWNEPRRNPFIEITAGPLLVRGYEKCNKSQHLTFKILNAPVLTDPVHQTYMDGMLVQTASGPWGSAVVVSGESAIEKLPNRLEFEITGYAPSLQPSKDRKEISITEALENWVRDCNDELIPDDESGHCEPGPGSPCDPCGEGEICKP